MLARGSFDYHIRSRFQTLPPKLLQLISNYRCNARCVMCNIWQMPHKTEMSTGEFVRVLDKDPVFDSIELLTLAGGEISLRSDLVELTAYLIKRLPRLQTISLVTNGFLPGRIVQQTEAILKLVKANGINLSMSVSIDGIGSIHDDIRGVPGGFDRVQETLSGLKSLQQQHHYWLGVGYVLMHQTLQNARQFRDWAKAQDLDVGFQLVGFHSSYVGNLDRQNEVDFRPEDSEELLAFMSELAGERSLRNLPAFYWNDMVHMVRDGRARTTPCPFKLEGLALDAYGDVYYCLSTPRIGNVLEEKRSVGDIYYDPKNLRYRSEGMAARACLECNSACGTEIALKKDAVQYLKFLVTGK